MIFKKIAELADQADQAGLTEIADALDAIVQEAALEKAANIVDEMIDADTMSRNSLSDAISKGIDNAKVTSVPKQTSSEIDKKHLVLEGKLRKIEKYMRNFGEVLPFMLPAEKLSGNAIRIALESIGIKNYKTWQEINNKLDTYLSSLIKRHSDKAQPIDEVKAPIPNMLGEMPLHLK